MSEHHCVYCIPLALKDPVLVPTVVSSAHEHNHDVTVDICSAIRFGTLTSWAHREELRSSSRGSSEACLAHACITDTMKGCGAEGSGIVPLLKPGNRSLPECILVSFVLLLLHTERPHQWRLLCIIDSVKNEPHAGVLQSAAFVTNPWNNGGEQKRTTPLAASRQAGESASCTVSPLHFLRMPPMRGV
jgi:hypothetical protein